MYEISVETEFCAAHSLTIAGQREPVHGHNWRVTVCVAGPKVDEDGLLLDFHALEGVVAEVIGPLKNSNLNQTTPFDVINPSAENVAGHIFERVEKAIPELTRGGLGTPQIRVVSVRVTEAPGCAVVYRGSNPPNRPEPHPESSR